MKQIKWILSVCVIVIALSALAGGCGTQLDQDIPGAASVMNTTAEKQDSDVSLYETEYAEAFSETYSADDGSVWQFNDDYSIHINNSDGSVTEATYNIAGNILTLVYADGNSNYYEMSSADGYDMVLINQDGQEIQMKIH